MPQLKCEIKIEIEIKAVRELDPENLPEIIKSIETAFTLPNGAIYVSQISEPTLIKEIK